MKIERINDYIKKWKQMGYSEDIPDEVPHSLAKKNLAPSYKAIAIAILNNDHYLKGLGYSIPKSYWYSELKRIEIEAREEK